MTRDRRLPGPAIESAGSPDDLRRGGLWASLKRAFGASEPPESVPFLTDDADIDLPDPSPRPVAPPAALPGEPREGAPPRQPDRAPQVSAEPEKAAHEIGGAERPPVSEEGDPESRPPRLARGLASFSRKNSVREKRFGHLLHDDAAPKAGPKPRPSRPSSSKKGSR